MKEFTAKQTIDGEFAARRLSDEAYEFYSGTDPLEVYEIETVDGKRYTVTGMIELDLVTFEEMQSYFEEVKRQINRLED